MSDFDQDRSPSDFPRDAVDQSRFDQRIGQLLNEHVDAQLGPRRAPAPFQPTLVAQPSLSQPSLSHPTRDGRRPHPWLAPLLAAACVAAVVVAALGLTGVFGGNSPGHRNLPAVSVPPPPSTTPTVPSTTTPTPSTATPSTATSSTPKDSTSPTSASTAPVRTAVPPPGTHSVQALGATLVIPDGWRLRVTPSRQDEQPLPQSASVCADPKHSADTCVELSTVTSYRSASWPRDVDNVNLNLGDIGQYCAPSLPRWTEQEGDRSFGGRDADWRYWQITCPDGSTPFTWEQYAVVTDPGFLLTAAWENGPPSPQALHAVNHALDVLTRYSVLPAQTSPLRFFDRGIVRSVQRGSDGVTITLDRTVYSLQGNCMINNNPQAYTYVIPTQVFDKHSHLGVGSRVELTSNGRSVLMIEPDQVVASNGIGNGSPVGTC